MSISTAMVAIKTANTALNTLVGTRMHPDKWEQEEALPAIRFSVISRPSHGYTMGAVRQLSKVRVQLDGFASSDVDRATLATAIRGAFDRASGSYGGEDIKDIRIDNEMEMIENINTSAEVYRIMFDLIVDIAG